MNATATKHVVGLACETSPAIDVGAIAAHGIGRGDFAALVFSGDVEAIGEAAGYCTWSTPRKFAIADPRIAPDRCLARCADTPLPPWPIGRIRPTPGVCFVFTDDQHPALDELRARMAVEHEHYVVLSRLTAPVMMARRIGRFLAGASSGPIVLLGYGDQGVRLAEALVDAGAAQDRLHVVDDRPDRQVAAANAGLVVVALSNPIVAMASIVSSPLACPAAFGSVVTRARADGRTVLDNALPWDDRAEMRRRGGIRLTAAADRALEVRNGSIAALDHGLALTIGVARECDLRMGAGTVRALRSGGRIALGPGTDGFLDPLRTTVGDPLAHLVDKADRVFLHLEGQSNHHDAAFAIFAAREFLATFFSDAVSSILPAEHRGAFGVTPFERLLPRTITGRALASPYMTACEQTAIGVFARHFCADEHPIVEIGSALGGSALLMAAASAGAFPTDGPPIFSVDPDAPTRPAMRAAFEVEGCASRLTQIVKTSCNAAPDLRHLVGKAGLVFIDGLHTGRQSKADFASYAALVRPGGCMAFHDCDLRHAGVFRTVAEIAATDSSFALRCMVDTIAVFERVG